LKLRDNTLVILTSDNGGMLNQGGQDAWKAGHRLNGDLLGFKLLDFKVAAQYIPAPDKK